MMIEKLNDIRKARGMTISELSEKSGVPLSTIKKISAGITKNPNMATISALIKVMDCTLGDLDPRSSEEQDWEKAGLVPYHPQNRMPLLGKVSCGMPMYAAEDIEGYIASDFEEDGEYFGLRARGDSMNALGINEGDIIVVHKQPVVENGEVAVVLVNGDEATVKRFNRQGDTVILSPQSDNPEHHPQIYNLKEISISVVGKVIELRKRF
ncbi:LexA family protein [Scatolibacter rhodanostii]|uniref:LexA family protein n=1 Tax=Scatolibacter rhodanostii TaxID=2014781 RepID=UPI000C08C828|nr:XRE family transcriptional regulator [Scatolibacter rhodanostii]